MSKYELVIVSGPLEGQRVRLDNQQTLLLGRTPVDSIFLTPGKSKAR